MSFVIAAPEVMAAAATDLANIGSSISAASAAAAGPTMGILAAGADEVSVAISALFGSHAQGYQTLSAQLAAYHNQFVRALNAGAGSYASAEAANVQQTLLNAINAPTQTLLGRPLIGNGADGGPGQNGGPGGLLYGNGGNGGAGDTANPNGGNGGSAGLIGPTRCRRPRRAVPPDHWPRRRRRRPADAPAASGWARSPRSAGSAARWQSRRSHMNLHRR